MPTMITTCALFFLLLNASIRNSTLVIFWWLHLLGTDYYRPGNMMRWHRNHHLKECLNIFPSNWTPTLTKYSSGLPATCNPVSEACRNKSPRIFCTPTCNLSDNWKSLIRTFLGAWFPHLIISRLVYHAELHQLHKLWIHKSAYCFWIISRTWSMYTLLLTTSAGRSSTISCSTIKACMFIPEYYLKCHILHFLH